jgi:hypothetical protein
MNPATGIRPLEQMDGEKEPTAVVHRRYRDRILKIYDPHELLSHPLNAHVGHG